MFAAARKVVEWVQANKAKFGGAILALIIIQGVAAYSALTTSTEVTRTDALAEFHRRQSQSTASPAPGSSQPGSGPPGAQSSPGSGSVPAGGAGGPGGTKAGSPQPGNPQCDWNCPTSYTVPDPGVYEYFQCGRETGQCDGSASEPKGHEVLGVVGRDLPDRGQRIVATQDNTHWNNIHVYSEEHREEFDLAVSPSELVNSRYKVDLTVGGHTEVNDIRQNPPYRLVRFPVSLGDSWTGHWVDANGGGDADYTTTVVGKEELTIGGVKVRTWKIESRITLLGPKTRGSVHFIAWVAPDRRTDMQEYYDQDLTNEQNIPYKATWMVTLVKLEPQR